jgi:hypothetical protein
MFSVYLKKKKEKNKLSKKGQYILINATSVQPRVKAAGNLGKRTDTVLVVFFWIFCINCTSFEVIFFIFYIWMRLPLTSQNNTQPPLYMVVCAAKKA